MSMKSEMRKLFAGACLLALISFAVGPFLFKWLWNMLVPSIFNGSVITYWQAWGLLILGQLFFGGFNFRSKSD